jgi:hypothetical protein
LSNLVVTVVAFSLLEKHDLIIVQANCRIQCQRKQEHGVVRNTGVLIWKLDENEAVGAPRLSSCDIQTDLKDTGFEDVNWIHLALDIGSWWAVVKMVLDLLVSRNAEMS